MRQLGRGYLQHGPRHGRFGSDPTPGVGLGLPVASLFSVATGVTIAGDNANHYVSNQDGVSGAGFATTDTDVFSNGSSTLFTGSAVYGIQIDAVGTYAIFTNAFPQSGGTAGKSVTAYWSASDGSAPSIFQQGRTSQIIDETWDLGQDGVGPHLFTHEWMTVSAGQTPAVLASWGKIQTGADLVMNFQIMAVQLTPNVLGKL